MLAESTINCETAHRNIQLDNFNLFISAKFVHTCDTTQRTYNDRRAVFEVFRPYRAHAASQLS